MSQLTGGGLPVGGNVENVGGEFENPTPAPLLEYDQPHSPVYTRDDDGNMLMVIAEDARRPQRSVIATDLPGESERFDGVAAPRGDTNATGLGHRQLAYFHVTQWYDEPFIWVVMRTSGNVQRNTIDQTNLLVGPSGGGGTF